MSLQSIAAPLARATRASSSSCVGLDFCLARPSSASRAVRGVASSARLSSPVPTAPAHASAAARAEAARLAAGPRWDPLPSHQYAARDPRQLPTHTLCVRSSGNNVVLTFTDKAGPVFTTITGGSGKVFKKAARNTHEAAHQAALKMVAKINEHIGEWRKRSYNPVICVAFKGFMGQGREAVSACIAGPDGDDLRPFIARVEDRTPIKIGGTRAPAQRRV